MLTNQRVIADYEIELSTIGDLRFSLSKIASEAEILLFQVEGHLVHLQISRPYEHTATKELTPRELEVMQLVSRGITDKQIADTLKITQRTVHSHLEHIYSKLDVNSRTAALMTLYKAGKL
jgi:DNA-binding NarL/FixJ family response regulator